MKKSKLIRLITFCFMGIFVVCTFLSYIGAAQFVGMYFYNANNSIKSTSVKNEFFNAETVEEHFKVYENLPVYALPKYICIFDENGNRVMESGSYIERYGKYYSLEGYLTDETKELLLSKQNKNNIKADQYNFGVKDFEYALDGDKIIPVTLRLFSYSIPEPENADFTLILSNEEPTHYLPDDDSKYAGNLVLYDIDNNSYRHKVCERMKENAHTIFEENKGMLNYSASSGGGGLSSARLFGSSLAYECTPFMLDGQYYMLTVQIEFNTPLETLCSEMFKSLIVVQSILLLVVYLICLAVALCLYRKNQRLEKTKNAFIGAAAHELKTPISAIENYSECIIEKINEEKNDDYIKNIYNESMRMGELVRSLLQYNRIASAEKIEKEKFSLTKTIDSEVSRYFALAKEKGVTLGAYTIPEADIKANEKLVTLAIDNFLSNALRHTESGGRIEVTLDETRKGTYRVGVFNEGKSIPDDIINDIWDKFYRSDKARNSESRSTGMGLAVSREIFKAHGFKYGVKNKKDGVEFWFETNSIRRPAAFKNKANKRRGIDLKRYISVVVSSIWLAMCVLLLVIASSKVKYPSVTAGFLELIFFIAMIVPPIVCLILSVFNAAKDHTGKRRIALWVAIAILFSGAVKTFAIDYVVPVSSHTDDINNYLQLDDDISSKSYTIKSFFPENLANNSSDIKYHYYRISEDDFEITAEYYLESELYEAEKSRFKASYEDISDVIGEGNDVFYVDLGNRSYTALIEFNDSDLSVNYQLYHRH